MEIIKIIFGILLFIIVPTFTGFFFISKEVYWFGILHLTIPMAIAIGVYFLNHKNPTKKKKEIINDIIVNVVGLNLLVLFFFYTIGFFLIGLNIIGLLCTISTIIIFVILIKSFKNLLNSIYEIHDDY